jgi:hypothetical protein
MEDGGTFMAILSILLLFGKFYGHLEYFSRFGKLYQERSGNPGGFPSGVRNRIFRASNRGCVCSRLRVSD